MEIIQKYPRTPHLEGSAVQPGDETLASISFPEIAGRALVITEKMDGANCGIRFTADGRLLRQSRGHYLAGGERERQFDLFKAWSYRHATELWDALSDRYLLYGEWLYAKHTLFYTDLPHYFLELDIYDAVAGEFLDTDRRRALLDRLPFVVSTRLIRRGVMPSLASIVDLMGPSPFIGRGFLRRLQEWCEESGLNADQVLRETDQTGLMEGLYLKVEEGGLVTARCKYVRPSFRTAVLDSQSHWKKRPIVPNCLRQGVSLF
jgi:RNA ligase